MAGSRTRRQGEIVFAILMVAFSVTAFWQAYAISGFSGLSEPGVFPMLASATMLVSAIVVLRDSVIRTVPDPEAETGIAAIILKIVPPRLLAVMTMILAYVVAMPLLGFVVSSALFLLAAFWFLWRRGLLISLALTAASLGGVYVVFRKVFQVVLPQGSLLQGLF